MDTGSAIALRGGFAAQGTREGFMEEAAFQLALRNWMSFGLSGMRRALQAEKTAGRRAPTKLAVHRLLQRVVLAKASDNIFFL